MDNKSIARWSGVSDSIIEYKPEWIDYSTNNSSACFGLLDTLVEKGHEPSLEYDYEKGWICVNFDSEYDRCQDDNYQPTKEQAILRLVERVIRKEIET